MIKKIFRFFVRGLGGLILLFGLAMFFSPDIYSSLFSASSRNAIDEWNAAQEEKTSADKTELSSVSETEYSETLPYDDFYYECLAYNQDIYEKHQADLTDPFSLTGIPTGLSAEDDMFGYIEIPAMDVSLPLYIGAQDSNLAKGAAILSQTSIPVSGNNVPSNCVIAGHRGYQGIPYFREIENLTAGDVVIIHNPWETLTYSVESIMIIEPDDIDKILIQDGRDMITLMTCHPYRSGGKYRYLVFCDRCENGYSPTEDSEETPVVNNTQDEFVSSEDDINFEKYLRRVGTAAIVIALLVLIYPARRKNKFRRGRI